MEGSSAAIQIETEGSSKIWFDDPGVAMDVCGKHILSRAVGPDKAFYSITEIR